jgi:hypothetical protein
MQLHVKRRRNFMKLLACQRNQPSLQDRPRTIGWTVLCIFGIDLPDCILQEVSGKIHLKCDEDEKIFMNGYQTWTVSPEYQKTSRIKGMHLIPKNLIRKYAFDRYADYHFVPIIHIRKGMYPRLQLVLLPAKGIITVCLHPE